jgi:hypothetical protein
MKGRRRFTRVNYYSGASIRYDDVVVICNADNVSLHGLFLKTDQEIPLDIPVDVTVYQSILAPITVSARVVRRGVNGVSVQIDNLSIGSFVQLRNIVSENSTDQQKIMQETFNILKHLKL